MIFLVMGRFWRPIKVHFALQEVVFGEFHTLLESVQSVFSESICWSILFLSLF